MRNSKGLIVFLLLTAAASLLAMPSRERDTPRDLRFGLMSEPTTLDPLSAANTADGRSVLFNVYEGLVKPDTEGRLVPAVAESVAISSNAMTYTFTLRQGIRFHDGTAVSIQDVEFSLNEARRSNFSGFNRIDRIELSGDRTIIIHLNTSDPEFLPFLTLGIVPRNNADREGNPIGTGPYMIESYLVQQSLNLVRNPHYWQPGLPKLDRVTVVFVADTNAIFTGLEGGNLNGAIITGENVSRLDRSRYRIYERYSNSIQLLALNNNVPPFDDIRVRMAVNYAIDPIEIIDTAFYGHGEPSRSPLIPGLRVYYNDALRNPYPVNLQRSRELLAQAGLSNGFSFEIRVPSNFVMHIDTAQVIVNQLARVNIRATIRLQDWATWLTETFRGRNFEATIISLDGNTVSPQSYLSRYVSTANGNFINYKNENYDNLFAGILREINEDARIRQYKEAQKIISDDAASVYIQDIFAFTVLSGGFRGVLNYPLYVIDFSTIYRE